MQDVGYIAMKNSMIATLLLICSLLSCCNAEEYIPKHGIIGIEFGCSIGDFEVVAPTVLQVSFERYNNTLLDPPSVCANSKGFIAFKGQRMRVTADFGQSDALKEIVLACDPYSGKSAISVARQGNTRLLELYTAMYETYGEPETLLMRAGFMDAEGKMINYFFPLVEGFPDNAVLEDITLNNKQGEYVFMRFYWDNMALYADFSGWHTKNTSDTFYYTTKVVFSSASFEDQLPDRKEYTSTHSNVAFY